MTDLGACIFGCAGNRLTDAEKRFFAEVRPLGFILFDRNAGSHDQIRSLTEEMREAAGHDALVLVDHEGGRVQRFRGTGWRNWLPALDQCENVEGRLRSRSMWLRYRMIAHELASVGVSVNCVPLADVAGDHTHPVIRNRCYGTDPVSVASTARSVADACLAGGLLPVLKHMPGHGGTDADSHIATPVNSKPFDDLAESEFSAFRELNHLPLGMTAHVVYESLDSSTPGTMSPTVIQHIRQEIGFEGLLMTDDISMSALKLPIDRRASAAIEAGCDTVLHCNGKLDEMEAIASSAGTLTGVASIRFEKALRLRQPPTPANIEELAAEFSELMGA